MGEFLSIPIEGNITHYTEGGKEQHDPQELLELLNGLLAMDEVEALRWSQYTPFFADGDPCVFGTGEIEVKLINSSGDGDREDGFLYGSYMVQRGPGENFKEQWNNRTYSYKDQDVRHIDEALKTLGKAMPHHYRTLKEKFGDPAEVVYDGERFLVEYYDHE